MEKLKVSVNGKEKTIEAEKFATGIYIVDDDKTAKKNVAKLSIKFHASESDTILQHAITKINKWAFLTSRVAGSYLQFIVTPSANNEGLQELIEGRDETYKQLLINAYNMAKLDMNNLDLMTGLEKQKN